VVAVTAVKTYVLTAYAPRAAVTIHGNAMGAAMPGLGGLLAEHQYGRAQLVRRELLALTWLFATAVGTTILLRNRSFVALWVSSNHYAGSDVDLLIVLIAVQDRKSTRLNSSHVAISYAVFCLKKKKQAYSLI